MTNDPWPAFSKTIAQHRDLAINWIQEMVRIPSDTGEKGVSAYIENWCHQHNLQPDIWEPKLDELKTCSGFVEVDYDYKDRDNLVVFMKGQGGGRSLTLNGHMDVVPVDPTGTWTYGGPWSGTLVDGRIYGRGALDMKSGLGIAMILIDSLQACKIQLKGDLQMQFVVDEENGGNGTLAAILRGYRSDGTIFLDAAVAPNYIAVSSRGAHFFRVTVSGIEGGIEYQFTQPNAIEKAFKLFHAVQSYALWRASGADHPLYVHDPTKIPAAICKIQAGNWPSTLPAKCIMEGSIECLPGEDIDQVCQQFKAYLLETARRDPWMREHEPVVEFFGLRYEAGATPIDDPLVTSLASAVENLSGERPLIVGGGGSDVRLPLLYANSPSVMFGPSGGSIHSTDEYVEIDSVMQVAQIVGKFILDWCEVAE